MADNKQTSGSRCHLLSLPAELRLHIYDFYFERRTPTMIYDGKFSITRGTPLDLIEEGEIRHSAALLRTCRTIAAEAQPLLLKNSQVWLFAEEPNRLVATDEGWRTYGKLEEREILSQLSRVRQWDLRCIFTSPRSGFQHTPELLNSLGWLEDVKQLKIKVFVCSPPNDAAYRKRVLEALDCLGKIRCKGFISITRGCDGFEEDYKDFVQKLGATEVPLFPDNASDSDTSEGDDHSEDDGSEEDDHSETDDEDGGDT
ncbi:hypothetical protein LTR37_014007 [Vermiconidia calcicola]|uniref:Uncharacterized protein n=1 Tax=Vermiconidia calcicola TaxID=1690605 RepID=A0ACC3MUT7_9PEZI|nr:hypothetical protein LTR37_014007 [Vermiconidia calcicola]